MACPAWRECNKKNCIEQEVCLGDYWPTYWKTHVKKEVSDKCVCFYCHRPFGKFGNIIRLRTKDHIIPKSKGGLNIAINYKDACKRCNGLKGSYTPEHFAAHLRYLLASGKSTISKETLELILDNTEILILEIAPFRHLLIKKGHVIQEDKYFVKKYTTFKDRISKEGLIEKRPSTPLWWRSTLK